MSHFYGIVEGDAKTTATRQGSKLTGLVTFCASWEGAIRCHAYVKNGIDYVQIEKITWRGKGEHKLLYDGPIGIPPQNAPCASPMSLPIAKHLDTPQDRTQSTSGPHTAIQ